MDEYKVIQTYHRFWYTLVLKEGRRVTQFVTFTKWGGMRQANKLIRRRQ